MGIYLPKTNNVTPQQYMKYVQSKQHKHQNFIFEQVSHIVLVFPL